MAGIIGGLIGGAAAGFGARHVLSEKFSDCDSATEEGEKNGNKFMADALTGNTVCGFLNETECEKNSHFCHYQKDSGYSGYCTSAKKFEKMEALVEDSQKDFCKMFDSDSCPMMCKASDGICKPSQVGRN